jgi:hypothetical protein
MIDGSSLAYYAARQTLMVIAAIASVVAVVVGVAAFLIGRATAADASPPLSLDKARAVVAGAGVNVGTIFPDGQGNRYLIKRVDARTRRTNVFQVEIEIKPLPRAQ